MPGWSIQEVWDLHSAEIIQLLLLQNWSRGNESLVWIIIPVRSDEWWPGAGLHQHVSVANLSSCDIMSEIKLYLSPYVVRSYLWPWCRRSLARAGAGTASTTGPPPATRRSRAWRWGGCWTGCCCSTAAAPRMSHVGFSIWDQIFIRFIYRISKLLVE